MAKKCAVFQSGVIPYLWEDKKLKVMLVTSTDGSTWIFPKGNLEKGLSAAESAVKEGMEEAGVLGETPKKSLGYYHYERGKKEEVNVELFPMKITKILKSWPEDNIRQRKLVSLNKAENLVSIPSLKRKLIRFRTSKNQ